MFTHAIIRPPSANFADGLTTVDLGVPDYALALRQHAAYCSALERCGLKLECLAADLRFPDATFVEDTAILTTDGAILTRPGAASRKDEVEAMRPVLARFFSSLSAIEAPGTVDGGDICEADGHYFIGISERTNGEGARQLATWLARQDYTAASVDIRGVPGILHLKSGIAYLSERRLVVIDALVEHPAFAGYEIVCVPPGEEYAANCVRVNDCVLLPAGFPGLRARLAQLGYQVIELAMSEFRKMDGGLSCLSLRW